MCGRTSCYCKQETYQSASGYFDPETEKYVKPDWRQIDGHEFRPSTNIAPTDFTPVLRSGLGCEEVTTARALQPMMWGLIPPWHQGDSKSHGMSTNNCRIENISKSPLYSPCLKKGKRCVILCEGFYEWQTVKGTKQPYLVYNPQTDGMKVEDIKCWEAGTWCDDKGWKGPSLLKMAGLFNEWHSPQDEIVYSYSVITMDANKSLNWLHHRMPAILTTNDQVEGWLDVDGVDVKEALELLVPITSISYHPVSTVVNNSRNKDTVCNKPIDINKKSKSSAFMMSWLNKSQKERQGTKQKSYDNLQSDPAKKMKLV